MVCLVKKKCHKCRNDFDSDFAAHQVVCGACRLAEATEALDKARTAAILATKERFQPWHREVLDEEFQKTLLRWVCRGNGEIETTRNMARFWADVKRGLEAE